VNTNSDAHVFQLPQPQFAWLRRADTATGAIEDTPVDQPQVEVASHSLQLLTAVVEAASPTGVVHNAGDTAMQPDQTVMRRVRAVPISET